MWERKNQKPSSSSMSTTSVGMEDMGAADDFIDIGDGEYVEDVTGEPDAIPEASATIGGGT